MLGSLGMSSQGVEYSSTLGSVGDGERCVFEHPDFAERSLDPDQPLIKMSNIRKKVSLVRLDDV